MKRLCKYKTFHCLSLLSPMFGGLVAALSFNLIGIRLPFDYQSFKKDFVALWPQDDFEVELNEAELRLKYGKIRSTGDYDNYS